MDNKIKIYLNDNDKFVVKWLRNLVRKGYLPPADIDDRPIHEVQVKDVKDYTQCHFFAGIGGWVLALELAAWPTDRHVWTGSCPCQPFSTAGRRKGSNDARHLWPEWFRLIEECKPPTIFGEQVASPLGRTWFSAVRADLETLDYAVGAADLCAASIGAPHIRQRLWFVADSSSKRHEGKSICLQPREAQQSSFKAGGSSQVSVWKDCEWLYFRDNKFRPVEPGSFPLAHGIPARMGRLRAYGNAIVPQVAAAFIEAYFRNPVQGDL